MFSDPQFWVAVSFILFIAAIFNPVRKILTSSLDAQIKDIKNKIDEVENLKNEAQEALDELRERESKVEKEIQNLKLESEKRIAELKDISTTKLTDQIEKRKILAENKIEQLVRDTNNSIKNYISSVAIEATRNILVQNLSKDKKSALIEESITEFNSVLKN
jgi:F-type H+-transporting ATPase subunit b